MELGACQTSEILDGLSQKDWILSIIVSFRKNSTSFSHYNDIKLLKRTAKVGKFGQNAKKSRHSLRIKFDSVPSLNPF